jgi:hypothetical protein
MKMRVGRDGFRRLDEGMGRPGWDGSRWLDEGADRLV